MSPTLPRIRVSDQNPHLLATTRGEPFFWLGDTAWELFHRCTREEARHYFANRQQKGFNVIQAVALAEFDGLREPNAYGDLPLVGDDAGTGGQALMTYHIAGGHSTSAYLHDESWLDINTMQSGHGSGHDVPVWEWIARDYERLPYKPALDAEPNYEDHPVNPWPRWDPALGYFRDYDVRKQIYRSVFAGACGVTYGHHAVWQFCGPRHQAINYADRPWTDAIDRPGAFHAGRLRRLMESRTYFTRVPDQSMLAEPAGSGGAHVQAIRDPEGSHAFVYVPNAGQAVAVDLGKLGGGSVRAVWFDPRTGAESVIGEFAGGGTQLFITPAAQPAAEPDWVLVLDRM